MAEFNWDEFEINPDLLAMATGGGSPTRSLHAPSPYREPAPLDRSLHGGRSAPSMPLPSLPTYPGPFVNPPTSQMPRPGSPTRTNPGTPAPAPNTSDPRAFIENWQRTHPPTRESYEQLIEAMKQAGFPVERPTRAGGSAFSNDKIVIGNQVFDLITDEGGPGAGWSFNPDGYWVNGRPASDPYGAPPLPEGGGMGGPGDVLGSPLLKGFGEFTPTDVHSILNSEVFKAARDEALGALQNSYAAKGTALTGPTMKELTKFSTSFGLDALGDQFNRDATAYSLNRGTHWGNQDNAYSRLADFTRMGQQGAGMLGDWGSGYGDNVQDNANNVGDLTTGQGNANAATAIARGNLSASERARFLDEIFSRAPLPGSSRRPGR